MPLPRPTLPPPHKALERAKQLFEEAEVCTHPRAALALLEEAHSTLVACPPSRARDMGLARLHLAQAERTGGDRKERHLRLGLSYARSTRSPTLVEWALQLLGESGAGRTESAAG